jgi:hypothetical protein
LTEEIIILVVICYATAELNSVLDGFRDNKNTNILRVNSTHPFDVEIAKAYRAKEILFGGAKGQGSKDRINFGVDSALEMVTGNLYAFFKTVLKDYETHYVMEILFAIWIFREVRPLKND